MPIFNNMLGGAAGSGGAAGYEIERSLRFNKPEEAYLNKTFSSQGSCTTYTISLWTKRGELGIKSNLFTAAGTASTTLANNERTEFRFDLQDNLQFAVNSHDPSATLGANGSTLGWKSLETVAVFRDPTAWYHIVVSVDTTQATASDRVTIWVNGVEQAVTGDYPTLNEVTPYGRAHYHTIGAYANGTNDFYDGYLADVQFVDGQALAETDFGEFDANGVWQPKEFQGNYTTADTTDDVYAWKATTANAGTSNGWYFTQEDNSSSLGLAGNTGGHPNQLGGNTIGARTGESVIGAYGSFATSNSVTAGSSAISQDASFSSGTSTLSFVYNKTVNKVWVYKGSSWVGGGNPANTSSTPTFSVPSSGKLSFGIIQNQQNESLTLEAIDSSVYSGAATGITFRGSYNNTSLSSNNTVATSSTSGSYSDAWGTELLDNSTGVNSFHLDFSDNSSISALGNDAAGSNNWTPNNLQVDSRVYATGALTAVNGVVAPTDDPFWIDILPTNADMHYATNNTDNMKLAHDGLTTTSVYWVGNLNDPTYGGNVKRARFDLTSFGTITSCRVYGGFPTGYVNYEYRMLDSSKTEIPDSEGTFGAYGWHTMQVTGNPKYIEISCEHTTSTNTRHRLHAIEVNGVVLVNGGPHLNDSFTDSPTNYEADSGNNGGNYCTLNPLDKNTNVNLSNGNLDFEDDVSNYGVRSTIFVSSGKWYWEVAHTSGTGVGNFTAGIAKANWDLGYVSGTNSFGYGSQGSFYPSNLEATATAANIGDVVGFAFDADAGSLQVYINGTSLNTAADANWGNIGDGPWCPAFGTGANKTCSVNFGQRPFQYAPGTSGGPSSDYKALCTQNLDDPTIDDGSTAFDVALWPGDSSTRNIPTSMSPDLVWIKKRSSATLANHQLFDAVRQATYALVPNDSQGENEETTQLTAFNTDGFSLGASTFVNATGNTYVGWAWDAGANSNKTYTVTVVSSAFRFDGHGSAAVTLDLEEGSTYVFDQSDSSNASHPLRFATQADAANASQYTTGVTVTGTPGQAGAKTTIEVASGAPTLYYYCSSHTGMGGQINTNSTAGATVLSDSLQKYDQSQTWSGDVSGTIYSASYPKSNAFDGNLETRSLGDTNGLTFTPSSAITVNTSLRIWVDYADSSATNVLVVNGTDYSSLLTVTGYDLGWITIPNISSITSIAYGKAPSGSEKCSISAIEVDGAILVDSNLTPPAIPSINSIVRANPSAGFSIVSYTGDGAASATIGHGLNAAPEMIMVKNRDVGDHGAVYHVGTDATNPQNYFLKLFAATSDGTAARSDVGAMWNDTAPTSSVFSVGTEDNVNASTENYIAYCWTSVEGYSAFGSYTGNGTTTEDGPFVYTGFRPRWILIKESSHSGNNWNIYDTARNEDNVVDLQLKASSSGNEVTNEFADYLSNGFKIKTGTAGLNSLDKTYIYAAFAEHPFNTARAR